MTAAAHEFLRRWRIVRAMTLEYLQVVPDDVLDLRPTPAFRTMREQAVHLAELQGVYQLALRGEAVDYERRREFSPASDRRDDVVAAMAERDREYAALVDELLAKGPGHRLGWHGMTLDGFHHHHADHERLHQGQWIAMTALAGHPQPPGAARVWVL